MSLPQAPQACFVSGIALPPPHESPRNEPHRCPCVSWEFRNVDVAPTVRPVLINEKAPPRVVGERILVVRLDREPSALVLGREGPSPHVDVMNTEFKRLSPARERLRRQVRRITDRPAIDPADSVPHLLHERTAHPILAKPTVIGLRREPAIVLRIEQEL